LPQSRSKSSRPSSNSEIPTQEVKEHGQDSTQGTHPTSSTINRPSQTELCHSIITRDIKDPNNHVGSPTREESREALPPHNMAIHASPSIPSMSNENIQPTPEQSRNKASNKKCRELRDQLQRERKNTLPVPSTLSTPIGTSLQGSILSNPFPGASSSTIAVQTPIQTSGQLDDPVVEVDRIDPTKYNKIMNKNTV
jgi:hypothetical protein